MSTEADIDAVTEPPGDRSAEATPNSPATPTGTPAISGETTITDAFAAAVDLSGSARAVYLAELLATRPDLHGEVISLLDYDDADRTLIEFEATPPSARKGATPSEQVDRARAMTGYRQGEAVRELHDAVRQHDEAKRPASESDRETVGPSYDTVTEDGGVITPEELAGRGDEIERRSNKTAVIPLAADYDRPTGPRGLMQSAARAGLGTVRGRSLLIGAALAALLILGGWSLQRSVSQVLGDQVGQNLEALAIENSKGVAAWARGRSRNVELYARSEAVRSAVLDLVAVSRTVDPETLVDLPEQLALREALEEATGYATQTLADADGLRYAVWRPDRELVGDWQLDPDLYGRRESRAGSVPLADVFDGRTTVYMPQTAGYTSDLEFKLPPEVAFTAPVYDTDPRTGRPRVAAALLIGGIFQDELTDLVQGGRFGATGETYAVNADGRIISASRFDTQLAALGWPQVEKNGRTVGIRVSDPGRDLTDPLDPVPLAINERADPTRMIIRLLGAEEPVVLQVPYRDYRGVEVVGSGVWLDDLGIGTIAEMDAAEAYSTLDLVSRAGQVGLILLGLTALTALGLGWSAYRLEKSLKDTTRLGPYVLLDVLGQGGMGTVWRAEHDLLKRPTAVKVLKEEVTDELASARFEREVKLASRLQSPHTIDVYDYGVTDNGRFYCAMALLDGLTLRELVARYGTIGPSRTVHLLVQVAKSLAEAHRMGLVHRDIKPANIMVCDRGGEADWVMVLDFGLAKKVRPSRGENITNTTMLIGTPDFIAPERIRDPSQVDPRSDLYAVGVVAYFLLTGQPCFETTGQLDALEKALYADPKPPSSVVPSAGITTSLDQLVLDLLKKDPAERIGTAGELLERLDQLPVVPWTFADARRWWQQHGPTDAD